MKESLNSIYLRLDVNMQYLASKAIAQVIVKILYSNGDGSMTADDIMKELAKLNDGKRFDEAVVNAILNDLENKELRQRNGHYYLSTNRREKIRLSVEESEKRFESILDKYFSGLNSSRNELRNWLTTITQTFFETYSDEWISDLNAHTSHIVQSGDSIRLQVTRRTNSIKTIDKEDRDVLPARFFSFVNSHDADVEDYLWGYGTSAFASKLICNKYGVDKLTMEAFKDSVCIFDTNVLLFIALESKYADSFKAIEKVFLDLNVTPRYLYITKKEYENKVRSQRDMTLSNFDKFGYDTISKLEDDFTLAALRLRCKTRDDIERFFSTTLHIPSQIHQMLDISLLDDDLQMIEAIEQAQNDEQKCTQLNIIYRTFAGHDKSQSACRHDIGLLEGVQYLRGKENDEKQGKYFIISDEVSVNQYSKAKGIKNNLPLSLGVDTLINMLAVNNGGDTFVASDYKPLFANIIRLGLIPRKDTFNQEELYQLSQMNEKISSLPSEEVCDIAMQMHRKRLCGESEDDMRRDLNVLVTRGELATKDMVRDIRSQLNAQGMETQRLSSELQIATNAIRKQAEETYDLKTKRLVRNWWIGIIVAFLVVAIIFSYIIYYNKEDGTIFSSFVLGIVGSAIVSIVGGICAKRKVITMRMEKREKCIHEEVIRRLSAC